MGPLRGYIQHLGARVKNLQNIDFDVLNPELQGKLGNLSCINVASFDVPEVRGMVGLYPKAVVAHLRVSLHSLSDAFASECDGSVSPLEFHQHEKALRLPREGIVNFGDSCDAANTGGHHDPGFACGPLGSSLCPKFQIPPSMALFETSEYTGVYRCNPELYKKFPFTCHAGDFTGKFGQSLDVSSDPHTADLRQLELDLHADDSCIAAERLQSLVLHCQSTHFRLACSPFRRLETSGKHILRLLESLTIGASESLPRIAPIRQLLATLTIINELETRIQILEKAAEVL